MIICGGSVANFDQNPCGMLDGMLDGIDAHYTVALCAFARRKSGSIDETVYINLPSGRDAKDAMFVAISVQTVRDA